MEETRGKKPHHVPPVPEDVSPKLAEQQDTGEKPVHKEAKGN